MKRNITYRIFLYLFALLNAQFLFAQNMSVNNTGNAPDASAMLDVSSTNKGMLIPRVSLTQTTSASPVTSPANSLLVYNTATINDVTPGFYYWYSTGSKWMRVGKTYTASNGMYITAGDDIRLGTNPLVENTTITQGNYNMNFNISGIGNFDIQHDGISKFYVKDGGNVGINNTNPGAQFDVTGPATGSGITIRAGGGGDVVLNSGGSLFFDGNYSYATGNYIRPMAANTQSFFTSGSERLRITSTGNVGVATTSPTSLFSVGASSQFQVNTSGDPVKVKNVTYSWPSSQGSTGTVLRNDGSGNLTWAAIGGGTKILDIWLVNATSYNLTGLDGNNDIGYRIILMGNHGNSDATQKFGWVSPNGDANSSNYGYSLDAYWGISGGGVYGWNYNAYSVGGTLLYACYTSDAPSYVEAEAIFNSFTGDRRHLICQYSLGRGNTQGVTDNLMAALWANTTDNITSMLFSFSGNTGFTGRLIVYKFQN